MSADFTHVIMTRFNLATLGREMAIRTQPGWLEGRFSLFEKYCLPSIAGQTNTNFKWIIYFDRETPQPYKDRIETLRKITPFTPYFTGLFPAEGWRESLYESFQFKSPLILTTRLDNDDALALDFVARLHTEIKARGAVPGAYNFQQGIIRSGHAIYQVSHSKNAFFSWLEPLSDQMKTAPSIMHMHLDREGPVTQISGLPAWAQIVHETNVSNKVRGTRVAPTKIAHLFARAITDGTTPLTAAEKLWEMLVAAPARSVRDRLITLFRR